MKWHHMKQQNVTSTLVLFTVLFSFIYCFIHFNILLVQVSISGIQKLFKIVISG